MKSEHRRPTAAVVGIAHGLLGTLIALSARGGTPNTYPVQPETPVAKEAAPIGGASVPDLANPLPPVPLPPSENPDSVPPAGIDALPQIDVVPPSVPRRPRFGVAIGMGVSRDNSGLLGGRMVAIPAFQVQVAVGDGLLGFEGRVFSNQAAGRYHERSVTTTGGIGASDMAVDRQALDAMLAFRPFAAAGPSATRWLNRVGRAVTLGLGVGVETASVGPPSITRIGPVVGLHVDLPLTSELDLGDLRIRIGARRMFAGQGRAGTVTVSDTQLEAFGGLALVF